MLHFLNRIYQDIQKYTLLKGKNKLLIAVSGGQDSICLTLILHVLHTQIQSFFDDIWLNHFWQRSSFFTMVHMCKYTHSFSQHVMLSLPLTKLFSEQTARNWRQLVMQRISIFYCYDVCAQGHTKSDRVETILFNLVRGSGMSGISTLNWVRNQMCFSTNRLYPLFFQFLFETHFRTTRPVDAQLCPADALLCPASLGRARQSTTEAQTFRKQYHNTTASIPDINMNCLSVKFCFKLLALLKREESCKKADTNLYMFFQNKNKKYVQKHSIKDTKTSKLQKISIQKHQHLCHKKRSLKTKAQHIRIVICYYQLKKRASFL